MVKKLWLGWAIAFAGLYGLQAQALAAVHTSGTLPTTTTLSASPNPQEVNIKVLFTATVTPTPGPTGTVDFTDNGSLITVCSGVNLSLDQQGNETASCQTDFKTPGDHPIVASYSGDSAYAKSNSPPLTEQITATPSSFTLGSQTASPYPTAVYSGGSAGAIPTDNTSPGHFTPLPTSVTESTIPYQPTLSPNSTAPGSGSNLLAIVVVIVVVLLIISAGAITLLLVVK